MTGVAGPCGLRDLYAARGRQAYQKMLSAAARFRMVLTPS